MTNFSIPYGRQAISEEDIQAVVEVLRSDWLTQGPAVDRFERTVAEYCGCRYAVAVNSGTSALHIACLAAGLGKGDVLWTTPNTFVASANCGLHCGASVDFVDIDPKSYNINTEELEKRTEKAKNAGNLPKVLIPVHFAGQSCEMERIREATGRHGITLIEDATHAIGGSYRETKVGSCAYSDMAVFSFHPVKIITTGEGGMVVTNRKDLYDRLVRLRSHGTTRDPELMQGEAHGPWYYQQIDLGFNYRITDIQAALGISQMRRLDEFVSRRRYLANRYNEAFQGMPLVLPWQSPDSGPVYHLYVIRLKLDKIEKSHLQIFNEIRSVGINVNLHYIPVHTQPYYLRLGFQWGDFPEAEKYYREAISIPIYYALTDEEQDFVIGAIKKVLR